MNLQKSKQKKILNFFGGAFILGITVLNVQFLTEDTLAGGGGAFSWDWNVHTGGGTGEGGSNYLVCDNPDGSTCLEGDTGWGWLS